MEVCEGGKILGTTLAELRDYVDVGMTNNLLRDYVDIQDAYVLKS